MQSFIVQRVGSESDPCGYDENSEKKIIIYHTYLRDISRHSKYNFEFNLEAYLESGTPSRLPHGFRKQF